MRRHSKPLPEASTAPASVRGPHGHGGAEPGVPKPGALKSGVPKPGALKSGVPKPGALKSGVPKPGVPKPGVPKPGVPKPGVPKPGAPKPGAPKPGVPKPGAPKLGAPKPGALELPPGRFSPGRLVRVLIACSVAVLGAALLGAAVGPESVDLRVAFTHPDSMEARIFFGLRLPRLILGGLVGAGLSAAGAAYQGLLRNPLADPFVLGVSGGAALGGTLALVGGTLLTQWGWALPWGGAAVAIASFAGAMLATLLAFAAGRRGGRLDPVRTLLTGVIFNSFAAALITLLKTMVSPEKAQELLFWLTGSLGYESASTLALSALAITVACLFLISQGNALNLLALGDEGAASLGVDVGRVRAVVFLAASMIVAIAVSLTGMLAFVGLLVPHLARLALGPDQRLLIPASALGGAAFLLLADTAARLLYLPLGTELPVGALTALAGGPFFLGLLLRERS